MLNLKFKIFNLFRRTVDPHGHAGRRRASSTGSRSADHLGPIEEESGRAQTDMDSDTDTVISQANDLPSDANFLSRPYWLTDDGLKKGEVDILSMQEELFWKDLLEKYLYPIDEDKAEKVNIFHLNRRNFLVYTQI